MRSFVAAVASTLALVASPAAADPPANQAPVLGALTINPPSVGIDGGSVDLSIPVTDPDGTVTAVVASASSAYGGTAAATLGTSGGDVWSGVLNLPANGNESADTWSVEITAVDDATGETTQFLGSVQQAGQLPFDQLPHVSGVTVTPHALTAAGGPVAIAAAATDDHAVTDVTTVIDDDIGGEWVVPMPGSGSAYAGTWNAPPNPSVVPRVYTLLLIATDDIGQERFVNAGQVTVAGIDVSDDPVDDPPEILGADVSPSALPAEGGVVDVTVQATDDRGVASARVAVSGPGIAPRDVTMTSAGGPLWTASVQLPSNSSVADRPFSFVVTVTDTAGATDVAGLPDVVVAGTPDDEPDVSDLTVTPGRVKLVASGSTRRAEETVVIANVGDVAPVVASLDGLDTPFSVKGGIFTFELQPGEQVEVTIVFRARDVGRYVDRLDVMRQDGLQPGLGVRVVGRLTR